MRVVDLMFKEAMLIAVLARFLFEISMADTDSSSMRYYQTSIPFGAELILCAFYFALVSSAFLLQFYDAVRTELLRPHRIDRVLGLIASPLQCCCFSRQTHH